jgi:hypothetical protein
VRLDLWLFVNVHIVPRINDNLIRHLRWIWLFPDEHGMNGGVTDLAHLLTVSPPFHDKFERALKSLVVPAGPKRN